MLKPAISRSWNLLDSKKQQSYWLSQDGLSLVVKHCGLLKTASIFKNSSNAAALDTWLSLSFKEQFGKTSRVFRVYTGHLELQYVKRTKGSESLQFICTALSTGRFLLRMLALHKCNHGIGEL